MSPRPCLASPSISPSANTTVGELGALTPTRKRRKVSRSKNGCLTCRNRRKRCDQEKPLCGACMRLKLDCRWYHESSSPRLPTPPITTIPPTSLPDDQGHDAQSSPSSAFPCSLLSAVDITGNIIPVSRHDEGTAPIGAPPATSMTDLIGIFGAQTSTIGPVMSIAAPLQDIVTDTFDNEQDTRHNVKRNAATGPVEKNTPSLPFNHNDSPFNFAEFGIGVNSQANFSTPAQSLSGGNAFDNTWNTLIDGVDFDEATLRLWAANCLAVPSSQSVDPFRSLSDLLNSSTPDQNNLPLQHPSTVMNANDDFSIPVFSTTKTSSRTASARRPSRSDSPVTTSPHHASLLNHYQASLSSLVSCTGDSATSPSAFAAFTRLAEASSSSEAGRGLHFSILAWAGRHMVNQGQIKYESVSEKLGLRGSKIILERLEAWKDGDEKDLGETERMMLLAGALMVIQWKICRGDVWGFEDLRMYLKDLSDSLYRVDSPGAPPDSMPFSFFENLVYHDLLSSFAYLHGPLVPYSVMSTFSTCSSDFLHTLTGACFPLFIKMHRIITLTKQRSDKIRQSRSGTEQDGWQERVWSDDELYDTVKAADGLEEELRQEKERMEALVRSKPGLSSHRYLHEAFRIACLLALHSFVLREPPFLLRIKLLVRQSLSLLEEMSENTLPGFCSAHWVLFVTGLCCSSDAAETEDTAGGGEKDMDASSDDATTGDRKRIEKLYDVFNDWAFGNIPRSERVVHEVWSRNRGGTTYIDWIDIVTELDWEIFMV